MNGDSPDKIEVIQRSTERNGDETFCDDTNQRIGAVWLLEPNQPTNSKKCQQNFSSSRLSLDCLRPISYRFIDHRLLHTGATSTLIQEKS